ncbi:MAG: ATP-binding protein [Flaviflexus sp.]|nr:ATP-binding protein [Flaviflexus sp.]
MDAMTGLLIAVAGLGVLVGAGGMLAFHISDRQRRDRYPAIPEGLEAILEAIPQSAVLLSNDGRVERASTNAYAFGLVWSTRIVRPEIAELVEQVRADRQIRAGQMTLQRSAIEGSATLVLGVRVAPVSRGRILVLFSDETGAKRLEETRRDFVANISHELKTPVGAIALLAETIGDVADEPENVRNFAEKLVTESDRLTTLIRDIIELSRLQDAEGLGEPSLLAAEEVVASAVERSRVEAEDREIEVRTDCDPDAKIYGDRELLTTAVRNLLGNAIRYSNNNSTVRIRASLSNGWVRIAVEDEGVGVRPEQRDRIFERFYRGDEARTRDTGGSGLGLSIVKHVVADHGGRVDLESEPGRGSTFTLVLPAGYDPATAHVVLEGEE